MRKVFRMQYEPCNGQCYAPSHDTQDENHDSFNAIGTLKNDPKRLLKLLKDLTAIHEPLCGNPNMRYGIDTDDVAGVFVGSFWHYGKLELVLGDSLLTTIEDLAVMILKVFETDAHKQDVANAPGLGHEVCHHGVDEDLRSFVLEQAKIISHRDEAVAYIQGLEQAAA